MADTDTAQLLEAKSLAEQLDALFAPWNRTDAPGLVVGVSKAGRVLYRRGFGMASLELGVAVTPAARMRIGSITKHFASLLALLLVEEGKLSIDMPIRAYIPELTGPGGEPTLRQLMQHTGGSRDYLDLGSLTHGAAVPSKGYVLTTQARQMGRNFAPGEAMIYNNGGYNLLSQAIERVGGASFEQQLLDRLFLPAGMTDTASVPSDYAITPGAATWHTRSPSGGWRRGIFPSEEIRGEGSIISTIDDMLRWTAHLRSRDKFGSPSTWAELLGPPTYSDGTLGHYALGLILQTYRGLKTIHHPGGMRGSSSQMLTLPDQELDIVIMANGAPGADPTRLAEQVVDIVLADLVGDAAPSIAVADYPSLLGDWVSTECGMIYSLIDVEGRLRLALCRAVPIAVPLIRKDGEVITSPGGLGKVVVDLDRALATDQLSVTVCGKARSYLRSTSTAFDRAAFAGAVVGRYHSFDASADLAISQEGDHLAVRISDGYGVVECALYGLSDGLGYTSAPLPAMWCWAALRFDIRDGAARGFQLNSVRTRNLEFKRLPDTGRS